MSAEVRAPTARENKTTEVGGRSGRARCVTRSGHQPQGQETGRVTASATSCPPPQPVTNANQLGDAAGG
jgi:hypothetical protein